MDLQKRKQIRLQGYDYSQNGAYFVTVCINNPDVRLWIPVAVGADTIRPDNLSPQYKLYPDKPIPLSKHGFIADKAVNNIPIYYPCAEVKKYCIMPDHVHMIILLSPDENGRMISAPTVSLSTIIGQMKRWVSKQIEMTIWQKSFYDRNIRNEKEYRQTWRYIDENPLKWQ